MSTNLRPSSPSSPYTLPIIDLSPLSDPHPDPETLNSLAQSLSSAFSTTGFAYLLHPPLSFSHTDIFSLSSSFFSLPHSSKDSIAKRSFSHENPNTYRGYFPPQPGQPDNLKEGLEIGPPDPVPAINDPLAKINLTEPNVWPQAFSHANGKGACEQIWREMQALSRKLLSLLALSMGKDEEYFEYMMKDSISTLRLLHYPPIPTSPSSQDPPSQNTPEQPRLCCTPHTDSGILTLLHQDETGGLEVFLPESNPETNRDAGDRSPGQEAAGGTWIPAPYIPSTLVVNIGDLMAALSGGRFKATLHRVRASMQEDKHRYSVPFFFEPGVNCVVRSVDCEDGGAEEAGREEEGVVYGDHVLRKMKGWVEFWDGETDMEKGSAGVEVGVEEVLVG